MTHLLVVDDDPETEAAIGAALPVGGYRVSRVGPGSAALEAVDRSPPHALVVFDRGRDGRAAPAVQRARARGVAVVAVVDDLSEPGALGGRLAGVDEWVTRRGLREELPARLARALAKRPPAGGAAPPVDGQFFALVIHDLRTPLNVIGLSLRMIGQAVPPGDPDLEEDLRFVEENFRQIERMLSQLGDYYRLFEGDAPPAATDFSPKRLVEELLETRSSRSGAAPSPVELTVDPSCPDHVTLDPARARMALQYALANANPAAGGGPIRLTLRGGAGRWVTEIAVDAAPPTSVRSFPLSPTSFERLCGSAAERRGMDLAIAAKVTEQFGGAARLDAEPGRGTVVTFDWPARLPGA